MIPAEAVEAAAKAYTHAAPYLSTENAIREALEAAAPYMLANAWDQGELAGSQAHALEEYPHLELTKNPYRPTDAV